MGYSSGLFRCAVCS